MKVGKARNIIRKRFLWLGCLVFLALTLSTLLFYGFRISSNESSQQSVTKENSRLSLAGITVPFVVNEGQWDSRLKFRSDLFSGAFLVSDQELIYSLVMADDKSGYQRTNSKREAIFPETQPIRTVVFKEKFISTDGKEIGFVPEGREKAGTTVSYFHGPNQQLWFNRLPAYNTLSLGSVYQGVEIELKAAGGNVEKFFYLNPGARVEDILVRIEGINSLQLAEDGQLILTSDSGNLEMRKPVAYQDINGSREYVEVAYELRSQTEYGFRICGSYDPDAQLVIDPALATLSASTFIGGAGNDRGYCLAVDEVGNVYVAGYTISVFFADFPTTEGAYDTSVNGNYDLFISKLNNSLTELQSSTYLGGRGTEYVYSMALDSTGNVYLTGITNSSDFPTTAGAYQDSYQGGEYDVFVTKMSTDLTSLLASTFFGGSDLDYGSDLKLDNSWNVYLTGMTSSSDFPVTPGAYQIQSTGGHEAFVARFSNSLDVLQACTFIGGSDYDTGSSLALGESGQVHLVGRTKSSDFPVIPGAYDTLFNGDYDVFIASLSAGLDQLLAATYLGGSGADYATTLALDLSGQVVVAGYTASADFPVTEGVFDTSFSDVYDVFISRFSGSLTTLEASTYLGGLDDDRCQSIALDAYGNVYLTGSSKSSSYPGTVGAYDPGHNGSWDVFVTKMPAKLGAVLSSTFLGSSGIDQGYDLALDSEGNVYVTGFTQSSAFPMTEDTYDETISGTDVFVAKFAAVNSYLLTINQTGEGVGSVKSKDGGIDCGSDCSELYDEGFKVTLTATPDSDSVFGGWRGDVFSTDNPLAVTVDSEKTITASFAPASATYTLTIVKSGPGNGTVTSEDEQISCGEVCSAVYEAGTLVKLTAAPDEFSGFDGWTGDVYGEEKTISFLMDSNKTVIVVFGPTPLPDLVAEWQSLKVAGFLGKTNIISGLLEIKNVGEAGISGSYKIAYYLSADGESLDNLLTTRSLSYSLPAESSQLLTFAHYLDNSLGLADKYVVAVMDPDGLIEEKDETNNLAVFGPISDSTGTETRSLENSPVFRKVSKTIKKTAEK